MINKKNCNEEVIGKVKEIKNTGIDFPRLLIVEYFVHNKPYEIKERLVQKRCEKIKWGFITVGYKTKSLIEIKTGKKVSVESQVRVKYNKENPREAYLPDNDSKFTWN